MNRSRVLHPDDYRLFTEHLAVEEIINKLDGTYRYEHEHRKWEYGLCLYSLLRSFESFNIETVLDVGGGGSIMSPLLAYYHFDVTQLDPLYGEKETKRQNELLGTNMSFVYGDFSDPDISVGKFDAVISISTIEHVIDDRQFFINLLRHSKDVVFLTFDFHPSGKAFSEAHERTYNKQSIYELSDLAKMNGFILENSDYNYSGNFVYDYTFGSAYFETFEMGR